MGHGRREGEREGRRGRRRREREERGKEEGKEKGGRGDGRRVEGYEKRKLKSSHLFLLFQSLFVLLKCTAQER